MKVVCDYEIGKGKKCNKVVYDDGEDNGITMLGYCLDHRFREEDKSTSNVKLEEELLKRIESLGIVDSRILAESMGIPVQVVSQKLRMLYEDEENKLVKGVARIKNKIRDLVYVYTTLDRVNEYDHKTTERYSYISMGV
jgi:hypothetical protein